MNKILEEINIPELEAVDCHFLASNNRLKKIYLPKLKKIDFDFLSKNMVLEEIVLPNIKEDDLSLIENENILSIINRKELEKKESLNKSKSKKAVLYLQNIKKIIKSIKENKDEEIKNNKKR